MGLRAGAPSQRIPTRRPQVFPYFTSKRRAPRLHLADLSRWSCVTPSNPTEPEPRVSLDGITVLVLEDEPDGRELVQWVLADASATVLTAASADEALALVKARQPDVIVGDIGMPERDGYQFMRDVRSLAAADGGTTPAIALTAFVRPEDRVRALLAGYQVHVPKPVEPQELLAAIRTLADARASR